MLLHVAGLGYAQVVFSLGTNLSNLNIDIFTKLCDLQTTIESLSSYSPTCENDCLCHSFSLVNYLTYLSGKKLCQQVTEEDVTGTVARLLECRRNVDGIPLDCWLEENFGGSRCNVSSTCADASFYELYHYIISKDTSFTNTYIHMAHGESVYPLYLDIHNVISNARHQTVKPVALDFGLKEYVFEKSLLADSFWIFLALFIVIVILWLYTESIFITCMVFSSMLFTIILSFTLYQFVFRINYFPFLNLLAAVVVVGIGADDLFIYWKTWTAIKLSRNASTLERIVSSTFKHASAAMFVTSASTATAFFACTYTDIVSVRCFCVYAGTCVLVHYILVITWLPACVVLYEKNSLSLCYGSGRQQKLCKYISDAHVYCTNLARTVQNRQSEISTLSHFWLPIFVLVSSGAAIALFYFPQLSPPSSDMFQLLPANHPFEVFNFEMKNKFNFSAEEGYLPVIFVFGVDQEFNGEYFKIGSTGSLVLRPLPDLSHPDTQLWFSNFCYDLRQQPFFDKSFSQSFGCFIEQLRSFMRFRSCNIDPVCCETLDFPYNESVFVRCLSQWSIANSEHATNTVNPGVRYRGATPSAVIISFWSNVKFDYNFQTMQTFYHNVTNFLEERVENCPDSDCEPFTPFFTTSGGLLFYDVQNILVNSLPNTLLIVIVAASCIVFLTTLNVLLTFSAILSIICSMLTTLGALALMGWELNILESIILSLAVGLSMDFPLHVAVAYKIASSTENRKNRVVVSLRHVGGSLTAAMVTTLVTGLCMLPTDVLAYYKLGTFLALVIIVSWFYAMFFMPSLLIHIGPKGSFLQINLTRCVKHRPQSGRYLEKTVYSDEVSSELTQPPPKPSSSHLETLVEECSEDSEINSVETVSSSTTLLHPQHSLRQPEVYGRLSPIAELHDETFSSKASSAVSL